MMNLARLRGTALGLLLLNVSLGTYLFATRNAQHSSEAQGRRTHLLPTFRADEVTELQIAAKDHPNLILIKDAAEPGMDAFHLGSLQGPHAEDSKLVGYLEALEYARFSRPRREASSPTGVPSLSLTITARGATTRLTFYASTAPNGALVSRQFGERELEWFEVSAALAVSLNKSAADFLPRLLFPLPRSETRTLEISGEPPLKFEARSGGFYLDGLRTDRDVMEGVFAQLARAKLDPPMEVTSLPTTPRDPRVVVTQLGLQGERTRVELGGACSPNDDNKVLAVRIEPEPIAGCVDRGLLSPLQRPRADFVDRKLTSLRPDEMDHIVLKESNRTFDLIRKDAGFEVRDPTARNMTPERALELFRLLAEQTSELIEGPAPHPTLAQGSLRVVGHGPNNEVVDETVEFNLSTPGAASIRRPDGAVLRPEAKLERLLRYPEIAFRDARLFSFDPSSLISVEHDSALGHYQVRRAGDSFTIEPSPATADVAAANQLWHAATELEAERFLAHDEVSPPSSDSQELRLTLHFVDPHDDQALVIGAKTNAGHVAVLSKLAAGAASRPVYFVLSEETERALTRLPISGQSTTCDPAPRRAQLSLETGTPSPIQLDLERRGTSLVLTQGEASLSGDEIWRLICDLSPKEPRPDLARTLRASQRVLRVLTESEAGPRTWSFYPDKAAPSWRSPTLIASVDGYSIPFAVDANAFETLLNAVKAP